jgi:hypothetical protein
MVMTRVTLALVENGSSPGWIIHGLTITAYLLEIFRASLYAASG